MSSSPYSTERRRLYKRFFEAYNSQYINYKKYYRASDVLGRRGRYLDYATTMIGGLLLFLLAGVVAAVVPEWVNLFTLFLSAVIAALSFASVTGNWQATSNEYYNAGQIHQRLYLEFDYMVKIRFPDSNVPLSELEKECDELIQRKNTLNEATPQLDSKWFKKLNQEKDLNWDPKTLEDVRDGNWDF